MGLKEEKGVGGLRNNKTYKFIENIFLKTVLKLKIYSAHL
jgi:hypothetical protein